MSAVEVSHLAKRYGDAAAVRDVSFAAEAGRVTAVLGPNGAGKTTTLECLCGLRTPDSGRCLVLGRDATSERRALRVRIGVMPQAGGSGASGVYPAARAREVLADYAALYAHPLPVDPLLDRLGLTSVARTPWRRLSGGEQQRLSLALALVGRPELVVLDEPTAGLDVAARRSTWDLVRQLRDSGVTVLLSTHGMDEAQTLADSVVIIDAGRVVASGTPAELVGGAAPDRQLSFDGPAALPLAGLLAALPDGCLASEPEPGRYVVEGHIDPRLMATVTAWCAAQGVLPDRISTGRRTLEDVFLELTGRTLR